MFVSFDGALNGSGNGLAPQEPILTYLKADDTRVYSSYMYFLL